MEEDLLEARRRELGHGVLHFTRGRGVELARDGDGDLVAVGDDRYGEPRVRPRVDDGRERSLRDPS